MDTARRPPAQLTCLPDILNSLALLEEEESRVTDSLSGLMSAREPIIVALNRLHSLSPQLDDLRGHALLLDERVSLTAKTADRVGSQVRTLDKEMQRVKEASERVALTMDIKVFLFLTANCPP